LLVKILRGIIYASQKKKIMPAREDKALEMQLEMAALLD
jgi:hypothetical protein